VTSTTFQVYYFNASGSQTEINGTVAASGKEATFTPSGSSMDGVEYVVSVKSGTSGVKSRTGAL
jgi:hypothetical protein